VFDGVLITDTFVMGWRREGDQLVFDLEASLWPAHPDYESPRPGKWTCYKPARLVFDGVRAVDGLPEMAEAPQWLDVGGPPDYGTLDELVAVPGGFRVAGDFGVAVVSADGLRLEVGRSHAEPDS
jgi:hypothetical protein